MPMTVNRVTRRVERWPPTLEPKKQGAQEDAEHDERNGGARAAEDDSQEDRQRRAGVDRRPR